MNLRFCILSGSSDQRVERSLGGMVGEGEGIDLVSEARGTEGVIVTEVGMVEVGWFVR